MRKPQYSGDSGNQTTLECEIQAEPRATSVYWKKLVASQMIKVDTSDSRFSGSSPSEPSLTITGLQSADTGVYQCFAENAVGTGSSEETDLRVLCKFKHLSLYITRLA